MRYAPTDKIKIRRLNTQHALITRHYATLPTHFPHKQGLMQFYFIFHFWKKVFPKSKTEVDFIFSNKVFITSTVIKLNLSISILKKFSYLSINCTASYLMQISISMLMNTIQETNKRRSNKEKSMSLAYC